MKSFNIKINYYSNPRDENKRVQSILSIYKAEYSHCPRLRIRPGSVAFFVFARARRKIIITIRPYNRYYTHHSLCRKKNDCYFVVFKADVIISF